MKRFLTALVSALVFSTATLAAGPSPVQKLAVAQLEEDYTLVLTLDLANKYVVQERADRVMESLNCISEKFSQELSPLVIDAVRQKIFNTADKQKKFADYNAALSGYIIKRPKESGCRFRIRY